jgi:hypothetical protein
MKKIMILWALLSSVVVAQTELDRKPPISCGTKSFQTNNWVGSYICPDGSRSEYDCGAGHDPELYEDTPQKGISDCRGYGGEFTYQRLHFAIFYGSCAYGDEPCKCDQGYQLIFDGVTNVCERKPVVYTAAVLPTTPNSCKVGNPIEVSSGEKTQKEIHIPYLGNNGVGLEWNYRYGRGTGSWTHQYDKKLRSIGDSQTGLTPIAESGIYGTPEDACQSGWNEIKGRINNLATVNGTSQLSGNKCQVMANGKVVEEVVVQAHSAIVISLPVTYVQLQDHLGGVSVYRKVGNIQTYQDMNGNNKSLLIKESDVWKLTYSGGLVEHYDLQGNLIKIISSSGAVQNLEYDLVSQKVIKVQDNKNHKLTFAYENNQIKSVTLDDTKTTQYQYSTNGLINRVTYPGGATRIYHYEDSRFPAALTGITDERNVRYATWAYDAQGRGVSSEHAGGAEKTLLNFNSDYITTVTNSLGKQTIYHFEYLNGAKRVVKVEGVPTANCLGANQNYTYTPEGWVESKTDWKGIKTVYQYNSLGQEISRTEAFGTPEAKTIKTKWHSSLNVRTKITEPERETIYSYDNNGLLLAQKTRSLIAQ